MRTINPQCPNIFAKKDPRFRELHNTLDGLFRKLRSEGVGSVKRSAEPFTKKEENDLWEKKIIGVHSPNSLFNAVFLFFFINGKVCCLRGGEEHRNLKLSQFEKKG